MNDMDISDKKITITITMCTLNTLPNEKNVDLSELKAFTDDRVYSRKWVLFCTFFSKIPL